MRTYLTNIRQRMTEMRQQWSTAKLKKSSTLWIVIGAVILTLILGFTRGGWTTDSAARQLAESSAETAVLDVLAPICVAQFDADPERSSKLAELKAVNTYKRSAFVTTQGWATMPGATVPADRVATECARRIALVGE